MESSNLIGQRLVGAGAIDRWQLQSALGHQRRFGGRIGRALVHMGFLSEAEVLGEVARQRGVPFVELSKRPLSADVVRLLPERVIRSRKVLPIAFARATHRGVLVVATSEPQNLALLDELAFASGHAIQAALAGEDDLELAINRYLGPPGPTNSHGRHAA